MSASHSQRKALVDLCREHAAYMRSYNEHFVGSTEEIARCLEDAANALYGPAERALWIVIPGGKDFPAKICTDPKREHETEIAVLYGDNGTEMAQQIVSTMNAAVSELGSRELPEELFDGHAVYAAVHREAPKSTIEPNHVSAVLDVLVRMIRKRQSSERNST